MDDFELAQFAKDFARLLAESNGKIHPKKRFDSFTKGPIFIGITINVVSNQLGDVVNNTNNIKGDIISGKGNKKAGNNLTDNSTTIVKKQTHRTSNQSGIDSASVLRILDKLASAASAAELTKGSKQMLQGRIDILREESSKPAEERDGHAIEDAVQGIKSASTVVSGIKDIWDNFGDTISGWFTG